MLAGGSGIPSLKNGKKNSINNKGLLYSFYLDGFASATLFI